MLRLVKAVVLAGCLVAPSIAFAQAEVTGTVRDSSGAVLPGVTVEAASPVLIEKVRTVATDNGGQFRIIDLRPGGYTVTFTLSGFNTVRREGVQLTGSAVVQVSVELRVGAIEETITVTGESPIVDVQSTTRQQVIDQEFIANLPTARRYYSLGVLIPGVVSNSNDVGGSRGDTMSSLTTHGSRPGDQRILLNGVNTSGMSASGNISGVVPNVAAAQEVTIDTSSVTAELGQGGVRVNYIPRDGGNVFAGSVMMSGATSGMQGDNFSQRVQDLGLSTPDSIKKIWDFNPAFGGPIKRDRVWFWSAGMLTGADQYVAGMFENLNAFNPQAWTYEADPATPAENNSEWWNAQMRVTWQASAKNKFAGSYDQQANCRCLNAVSATVAPEAAADFRFPQQRVVTAEWTSPRSNRVLLEAVGLHRTTRWGNMHPSPVGSLDDPRAIANQPLMISVTEQSTGLLYRARVNYNNNWNENVFFRGSMSYVTGAHAFKVGFNNTIGLLRNRTYAFQPVSYRFNNGVPNQVTLGATPFVTESNVDHDLGIFVQDRFTTNRLTLTLGLRLDDFKSSFPEQEVGPGPLVPGRNLTFPAQDNLGWHDLTYRSGLAYDLFGDGKTALKASLNKYVLGQTLSGLADDPGPIAKLVNTTTRTWNDATFPVGDSRRNNFVADCDMTNPVANGECQAMQNAAFGTQVANSSFDPNLLGGWGHRPYNWEFSVGVQREIVPRVSMDVGYFRRWYGNFRITDNLALSPSDYTRFQVTAPSDSGLPGGGGQTLTVFNQTPGSFGRPANNYNTLSDTVGKQTEHWNGVDLSVLARLQNGIMGSVGMSTGKLVTDNCAIVAQIPEMLSSNGTSVLGTNPGAGTWMPVEHCHQEEPFLTQFKAFGTYTIPRVLILVSGTLQSTPGAVVWANFNASNAYLAANSNLGRPLSGGAANITINVAEPGEVYVERLNQLDFRVGKIFRFGGRRASVNLDIYNTLNADAIRTVNNTFGTAWQRPTSILQARFAKVSASFDF